MFRKGHRLFSIAALGLIVVAILHSIEHFSAPSDDPVAAGLLAAMQAYTLDLGFGRPSLADFAESLSLNLPLGLLWIAVLTLAVARYAPIRDKLVRKVCSFNVLGIGALVALYVYYKVPSLAIALGIVEILFVLARYRMRHGRMPK